MILKPEKISENPVFDKVQNQSKKEELKAIKKAFKKIIKSVQLDFPENLPEENNLKGGKEQTLQKLEDIKSTKDVLKLSSRFVRRIKDLIFLIRKE